MAIKQLDASFGDGLDGRGNCEDFQRTMLGSRTSHASWHWGASSIASSERTPVTQVLAAQPAGKLVRRRHDRDTSLDLDLSRRRWGAMVMAVVSIFALAYRRQSYDSFTFMALEGGLCTGLLLMAGWLRGAWMVPSRSTQTDLLPTRFGIVGERDKYDKQMICLCLVCLALLFPWLINTIARSFGRGNGTEIVMLGSLAWGGVVAALVGAKRRTVSLSVICSGFLTLFTTFIGDSAQATWFAAAWGILCVWWLIQNHWEQVESTAAVEIRRSRLQRFTFSIVGCLAFTIGAGAIANRIPVIRKLHTEVMPTSGGTTQKDSVARSGVGNGDALVAAKNHASSFGAVETDVFLDSEQTSLFDVFSDEFGEPKKKDRVEQAQALSPNDTQSNEGQFAEANRAAGGERFSVEREAPQQSRTLDNLASNALMFWEGEAGAHLAVERFTNFDGQVWSNGSVATNQASSSFSRLEPKAIDVDGRTWMLPSQRTVQNSISPFVDALPEALKFTGYRSPIIPTRAGVQLWSIDWLPRSDFFQFSDSECLSMPGREHVPDYTVVRMVNSRIDLKRLQDLLSHCAPGQSHTDLRPSCQESLNRLAHELAAENQRGWLEVHSVINGLRSQFQFDRSAVLNQETNHDHVGSVEQFLQNRRGPSYLFATTAALMLEHLGYENRFVTGFYANPEHYLARDGEYAIQPSDAHTWIEIHAGHGYWVPLEATPGFLAPQYSASLWYRLFEARAAIGLSLVILISMALLVYCLRRTVLEVVVFLLLLPVSLLNDRQRIGWLAWVFDQRLRLAGQPREAGTVLRSQVKNLPGGMSAELKVQLETVFLAADRLTFGSAARLSPLERAAISRVWRGVTVRALRRRVLSPQTRSS